MAQAHVGTGAATVEERADIPDRPESDQRLDARIGGCDRLGVG